MFKKIIVLNTKEDILKNVCNQTVAGPELLFIFWGGTSNCFVTHILQNILFFVQDKNTN